MTSQSRCGFRSSGRALFRWSPSATSFCGECDRLSGLYKADLQGRLPTEPLGATCERELAQMEKSKRMQVRYLPIVMQGLAPGLTAVFEGRWTKSSGRDAVLVVAAAQLHHRRHGAWPPTTESLAPEFLQSVPFNPYDGRPLRLRVIDGRLAVYSVGLNMWDDTADMRPTKSDEIHERDWLLFPPIRPKPDAGEGN